MQVHIKYFARYRELLSCNEEVMHVPDTSTVSKINDVIQLLTERGGDWHKLFSQESDLLCSINHELVSREAEIADGDEVAFFPPVTGG